MVGHPRVAPHGSGGPSWLSPPGMSVQMRPQPVLVHLCPRGHCESASHSSAHRPPSLSQLSAGAQPSAVTQPPSGADGQLPLAEMLLLPLGMATHSQVQPVLQHFSSRLQTLSSRHWLRRLCRGSQHGSACGHCPGCSAQAGTGSGCRSHTHCAPCRVWAARAHLGLGGHSAWHSRRSSTSPAGDSPCHGRRNPPPHTALAAAVASPSGTHQVCLRGGKGQQGQGQAPPALQAPACPAGCTPGL